MEWTRSETLVLAAHSCVLCNGLGLRTSEKDSSTKPCNCVFRNIFRACYARFRECAGKEKFMSHVSFDALEGATPVRAWGRKDEEYVADFSLLSRRSLDEDEYRIFKFHFLLGADWKLCCRRLNLDRGAFFHAVYRIQNKLGRVFAETEPYALYPLQDYFHRHMVGVQPTQNGTRKVVPIKPPVRKGLKMPERKAA